MALLYDVGCKPRACLIQQSHDVPPEGENGEGYVVPNVCKISSLKSIQTLSGENKSQVMQLENASKVDLLENPAFPN